MTYETDDDSSKEFRRTMSWREISSSFASGSSGSILRDGAWTSEIESHAQVPRSTCHRWITWAEEGRTLEDLSRKPKRTKKTSWFVVIEIIVLRLLFWWGPDKIKAWLARQGTVIGQRTIYRIIYKWGLNLY